MQAELYKGLKYIDWFNFAPDEHVYISYIYSINLEHELKLKYYNKMKPENATTFVLWKDNNYLYYNTSFLSDLFNFSNFNHPITYSKISNEELLYLVNAPCLFGRKFDKNIDLKYLLELIN